MITFTLDLEDYWLRGEGHVPLDRSVDRILDAAALAGSTGTVFVVGELAERRPDLVQRCRGAGHEIALHGYRHVPIDHLGPDAFRSDVRQGKTILEDLIGATVHGYRAPMFSLTARTPWAPRMLSEEGFEYSSSVLPGLSPIRGFPGLPSSPFRWEGGPLELPCPVAGLGRWALPYLGGVYLRYIPLGAVQRLVKRAHPSEVLWLYCHPYDVDDTRFALELPQAGAVSNRILSARRGGSEHRIRAVLQLGSAPTLLERAGSITSFPVVGI